MIRNNLRDLTLPKEKFNGIYRGVVEDNVDPLKAGRCKVRIFGLHTSKKTKSSTNGIPTNELPWAEPATSIFGGISKCGIYGVPCQGAHVFLFFEAGNIMRPIYFATAPAIPYDKVDIDSGFNDPNGVYPLEEYLYEPDWKSASSDTYEYPNSLVISTPSGHTIEMDYTDGNEKIVIKHGLSGANITFTKEGSIQINSAGNTNKENTGAKDITISGNYNINCIGNYNIMTNNFMETVSGTKSEMIMGGKDQVVNQKLTQKSNGMELVSDGSSDILTSDETNIKSGGNIVLESKTSSIEETSVLNHTIDAGVTATVNGAVSAKVTSDVMVQIKGVLTKIEGSMIMIG